MKEKGEVDGSLGLPQVVHREVNKAYDTEVPLPNCIRELPNRLAQGSRMGGNKSKEDTTRATPWWLKQSR